jgi:hypothetical protein
MRAAPAAGDPPVSFRRGARVFRRRVAGAFRAPAATVSAAAGSSGRPADLHQAVKWAKVDRYIRLVATDFWAAGGGAIIEPERACASEQLYAARPDAPPTEARFGNHWRDLAPGAGSF